LLSTIRAKKLCVKKTGIRHPFPASLQTKSAGWQSERNEVILKEKRASPYCCRAVEFFVQALEMNPKSHTTTKKLLFDGL